MEALVRLMTAVGAAAFVGALLWLLRRRIPLRLAGGQAGRLRILAQADRLHLSPQHSVHVVRVGDRGFVLVIHSGGCTLLETRPWSELRDGAREAAA